MTPRWPTLPRGFAALLCAAAFAAAFWRLPQPAAPAFVPPPPATASALPALFAAQMLPTAGTIAQTPSLVHLPDGRLAAAWAAGSAAEATDLAIYFSTLGRAGWSEPQPIVTRETAAGSLFAHIRRVGQPVLQADGDGLHLWFIAFGIGGNTILSHSQSSDGGRRWSAPRRLATSPLAGFGTTLGAPPLPLADGGRGLPLQRTLLAGHGEWLRLTADGRIVDKARLPPTGRRLPPAIIAIDQQRAIALAGAGGQIGSASTANGGRLWQAGATSGLPGADLPLADLPLAVLRLASGRLLLAGNPPPGRETLALWLSADNGQSWQAARQVESASDSAADFTAPALALGGDGRVHLAYAWRGQGIRYVTFSEAWLAGERQ